MEKPARIAVLVTMVVIVVAILALVVYLWTHGTLVMVLASIPLLLIAGAFGMYAARDIKMLRQGK